MFRNILFNILYFLTPSFGWRLKLWKRHSYNKFVNAKIFAATYRKSGNLDWAEEFEKEAEKHKNMYKTLKNLKQQLKQTF